MNEESMPKQILNPDSLFQTTQHGFSQIVVARGNSTVFISGQTAWDANKQIVGRTCAEQARQAFHNVEIAIGAAGGTLRDIVALRIYVVGLRENIDAVGSALKGTFAANPPAATWIGVASLAVPEFLIEVEATAVMD